MNEFSFEYPLLLLLFFLALYCLYRCREYAEKQYFVHLYFLKKSKKFIIFEKLIILFILLTLILALSSPLRIDKTNPLNRFGKDIVLAMDGSGSMSASGFDESREFSSTQRLSRFELSKIIAKRFILKRESDNIAVVLYGDFAFIASPLTYEKEILSDMLDYLTQGMAGQNTAIGEAIALSVRAFKYSKAKEKIIVLLTDGEHNSGAISPKDALVLAKRKGIKIYTISMGESISTSSSLLEKIAKESEGNFYSAPNAKVLEEVYSSINDLESSSIKSKEYLHKEYYYFVPLSLALFMLIVLMLKENR